MRASKNLWLLSSLLLLSVGHCEETPSSTETKSYELIEDRTQVPILTPSLQNRKIAKIRLYNGLEAYIISDPDTPQSGAALSVHAGSWDDPEKYPGMAHFCEHMLFMGTKKYPKEFEYMQYVSDNGGSVNAYTAPDRTVYMFSVNNNGFEGSLDRFSHFFIDPLFSQASINRELLAVDQEHAKNLENDGWRAYMVFKETGNPDHPNHSFSTGNAKTLGGIPFAELKKWYENHYSANQMHLVVVSPLPLNDLIDLVQKDFSEVPNHSLQHQFYNENMTSANQIGKYIYIKPVKDIKQVTLNWEVPKDLLKGHLTPFFYPLCRIINYKGQGGLESYLKDKHLIESLKAFPESLGTSEMLFSVQFNLTEEGLKDIDTVIDAFYSLMAEVKEKGIPDYIVQDTEDLTRIGYQYQGRSGIFDLVQSYAHQMVDEPLETFPERSALIFEPDTKELVEFVSQDLTPEKGFIVVEANPDLLGIKLNRQEKWMGAEYKIEEVSPKTIYRWNHMQPNSSIVLPPENPFIAQDLNLVSSAENTEFKITTPNLLVSNEGSKIYFAGDDYYRLPTVSMQFGIKSPLIEGSAKSVSLLQLFFKCFHDKLDTITAQALEAGYNYSTSYAYDDLSLVLTIDGYSDKIALLAKTIFENLKQVSPSKEDFEDLKNRLKRAYDNSSKELPAFQAVEYTNSILFSSDVTDEEKLAALEDVTYEEFTQYSFDLFNKAYVQGVFTGNLTLDSAKKLWSEISGSFSYIPYKVEEQKFATIRSLDSDNGPHLISLPTERLGNGVVLAIEEGPFTIKKRAAQMILSKTMSRDFFETLRTQQQTAYIAYSWASEVNKQMFQYFAVQSNTHYPEDLLYRFELFLEDYSKDFLNKLPKARFANLKEMLVDTLNQPPESMDKFTGLLYSLAFDWNGNFQYRQELIKAIQATSYEEVNAFVDTYISRANKKRLAVMAEGIIPKENSFRYSETSKKDVINSAK